MPDVIGHKNLEKPDGSTAKAWHAYICGECGNSTSGIVVGRATEPNGTIRLWLECTTCGEPSAMNSHGFVSPPMLPGIPVDGLPADVSAAYDEARRCLMVSATTGCELVCRKILMHVAVDKGSDAGKSFVQHLDELAHLGYITPPMRPWVDLIRANANEATHQLTDIGVDRATSTLTFTAEMLRIVYEMESFAAKFAVKADPPNRADPPSS